MGEYWIVDPVTPAITVLESVNGNYVQKAHVVGHEVAEVQTPFPIILNPAILAQG